MWAFQGPSEMQHKDDKCKGTENVYWDKHKSVGVLFCGKHMFHFAGKPRAFKPL